MIRSVSCAGHAGALHGARGFTLVEIAIVLVIIGLLTAGILKGTELINQARIKNGVADFNGATAAFYAYQDRYRKLPGDDDTASRWSGLGVSPVGGNGNGALNPACTYRDAPSSPPTSTEECNLFWWHLRLAQLIGGPTDAATGPRQAANFANGIIGVQSRNTPTLGLPGLVVCSSNIPPPVAIGIDNQIDDGRGDLGNIRGRAYSLINPTISSTATGQVYTESGGQNFVLCQKL